MNRLLELERAAHGAEARLRAPSGAARRRG